MKSFCRFVLRVIRWRIVGETVYPTKCVICVAPHTSNWDLLLGLLVYTSMGRKAYFLIKKDWFFFPLNFLFKSLGGIPVDRSVNNSLTDQMAEEFKKRKEFQIAITPEGTRQGNREWKKGFYYIALAANVPIVVVALDYKKKEVNFKKVLYPSGNIDVDMPIIRTFYEGVTARHPEKFIK